MISEVFYWLLSMSMAGSLAGLAAMLLRRIPRTPRWAAAILWTAALLRLWIPWGMGSSASLLNPLGWALPVSPGGFPEGVSMLNAVRAAEEYFPLAFRARGLEAVFSIAGWVWLAGVLAGFLGIAASYAWARREVRRARRIEGNVFESEEIASPVVYGLFRPKILLPASMEEGERRWALLHERAHLRRADNLRRFAAALTVCLHWFNPLIWMFLKRFLEDLELACDEAAIRKLSSEEQIEYGRALLRCAARREGLFSPFGGANARLRVQRVLSYRRLSVASAVALGALVLGLAGALLTNPRP